LTKNNRNFQLGTKRIQIRNKRSCKLGARRANDQEQGEFHNQEASKSFEEHEEEVDSTLCILIATSQKGFASPKF
jgi:hypothetical protein